MNALVGDLMVVILHWLAVIPILAAVVVVFFLLNLIGKLLDRHLTRRREKRRLALGNDDDYPEVP